jgi:2-hydroxy-3-keto-5-methylthiopentenyl-1-phosphate phosphatase
LEIVEDKMPKMSTEEIMEKIKTKIDSDEGFREQIEDAVESGTWEFVADLIAKAVGFVIKNAREIFDWLRVVFAQ